MTDEGTSSEMPRRAFSPDRNVAEIHGESPFPLGGRWTAEGRTDEGTRDWEGVGRRCPYPAGRAGGAGAPRGIRPPFSFVLTKENPPEGLLLPLRGNSPSAPRPVEEKTAGAAKRPLRGLFAGIRGSGESVRRVLMAPSTLRYAPAIEIPCLRIDPAAVERGCLSTWFASLFAAAGPVLGENLSGGRILHPPLR